MIDKLANDARIYTDVQGLENLRYAANKNQADVKKVVAQQFESMLMQTMIHSMRDANKAFASDLFGSNQMDFYQDMFDKQLSLIAPAAGLGFAKEVEKNIDAQAAPHNVPTHSEKIAIETKLPNVTPKKIEVVAHATPAPIPAPTPPTMFNSQEEFVKTLWSSAKSAAKTIGVDPKILLAQAALETNWGKKILPNGSSSSSNNLFNIKADHSWDKETTTVDTVEQKNGVLAKEKSTFRSYGSITDSFKDYVEFLKKNTRYAETLSKAADPKQYVHALQKAGFATDLNYADKILKIFSSHAFNSLVEKLI